MNVLTISGSTRQQSANTKLVKAIPILFPNHSFRHYNRLDQLPLFKADSDKHPWNEAVLAWRAAVKQADAILISTPAYIYNLPALLKNALEWVTSSGEFAQKRVLAITFTPHAPRGEKAMQSLLWSLQALDAQVVAQLPLYQNEIFFDDKAAIINNETSEMLQEAVKLLFD